MYSDLWTRSHPSICSLVVYGSNNARVQAFSGFKIKNYIVTDDGIFNCRDGKEIEITFYREDGYTKNSSVKLKMADFLKKLPDIKEFENLGFALIPQVYTEFENIHELKLCGRCENPIGKSIGIIGYQFEHNNLSLKTGVISSFTRDNSGHSYIQYDGTIKQGNSGAPLLKLNEGSVIGIVNNKVLGIVKSFKEMISIIDSNLEALEKIVGKHKLDDIDIVQVLIANQHQVKHISKEFFKNATVRMGYALEIGHLTEYLSSGHQID